MRRARGGGLALVIASCTVASCSSSPARVPSAVGHTTTQTRTPPTVAASPPSPASARPDTCPKGSALPSSQGMIIDYVDFVRVDGTMFLSSPGAGDSPAPAIHLGPVVARVRCSLRNAPTDRSEPPTVDGTAAFLAVGTELHSVPGFPPSCRLAAKVGNDVRVYLAQGNSPAASTPLACALR